MKMAPVMSDFQVRRYSEMQVHSFPLLQLSLRFCVPGCILFTSESLLDGVYSWWFTYVSGDLNTGQYEVLDYYTSFLGSLWTLA